MPARVIAFEEMAKSATQFAAIAIDVVALLVIAYAALRAFALYVILSLRREQAMVIEEVRLGLGRNLILGLEFLIGADILRTAIAPSWNIIGQLAAIIVLRTLLDYFLEFELTGIDRRRIRRVPRAEGPRG